MINNRNTRIKSAEQTLQIIHNKQYSRHNTIINIASKIDNSVAKSKLYTEELFRDLLLDTEKKIINENYKTIISVENCTSMEAAEAFLPKNKIGCLNFASAKNPGGGFISGSQAQEESLSRASALYPTQMKFFESMYEYNRSRDTLLYSDRMVYSPEVCFFKDDDGELLLEPYCMDILTSPAVNINAMIKNRKMDDLAQARDIMISRVDKILSVFYMNGVKNLILGAWGCGVFGNKPIDVANYFAHFLLNDGKYNRCFEKIVFAVYSTAKQDNILAFEKVFK